MKNNQMNELFEKWVDAAPTPEAPRKRGLGFAERVLDLGPEKVFFKAIEKVIGS